MTAATGRLQEYRPSRQRIPSWFDLGQLLVGLVHTGELPPCELPTIADVLVPAYVAGAAAEGLDVSASTVATGFALSALLRSGYDAFRLDLLDRRLDDAASTFAERIALQRDWSILQRRSTDSSGPQSSGPSRG